MALYEPDIGFYTSGGSPGRRGDFLTSPETGPLFGAVIAGALDEWWGELDRPDPFFVIDAGAGPGTLARAVLAATPACAPALRYVLVDRSPAMRARHHEHLPLEPASWAFAGVESDEDEPAPAGIGPLAVSLGELPSSRSEGVVIANELLDNLPFALCQWDGEAWAEVWVGQGEGDTLAEVVVPARPAVGEIAERVAAVADTGARVPVGLAARAWLRDALDRLERGRVVVFDYLATTGELAARPQVEWLRTYRDQAAGSSPLEAPGTQDITCEVPVDQLFDLSPAALVETQAAFLERHGLQDLVEEGRRRWAERGGVGDLEALRARSRVREAEALTDPAGLGAFAVAHWLVG